MSVDTGWRRGRSVAGWAVGAVVLMAAALLSYWAGTQAVAPPALPVSEARSAEYEVQIGEVSSSLHLAVTANWETAQSIAARASGVVTTIPHHADGLVHAGDVLATIQLRPVVAAVGSVPMFRDLHSGSRGRDVRQLEALLVDLGYFHGKPDSVFRAATTTAVKRWQRRLGVRPDGVVGAADIVFVEHLPAHVSMRAAAGDTVTSGSPLVEVLRDTPTFTAYTTSSQRAQLSTGMPITVSGPNGEAWAGTLSTFAPTEDGRFATILQDTPCPSPCGALALHGETALQGAVTIQPLVRGPVVPESAIMQDPAGGMSVTTPEDRSIPVTVLGAADGFAVVDGLAPGTVIRLPESSARD